MEQKFKIGDIVKLKSGSPKMTIQSITVLGKPNQVRCSWFEGDKLIKKDLHQDTLIQVSDGEG